MTHLSPVADTANVEIYESDHLNDEDPTGFQARSTRVAAEFRHQARSWLDQAGASWEEEHHLVGPYHVEGVIAGENQQRFLVLVHGVLDDDRQAGLRRSDTVKKAGNDANKIRRLRELPILLITSHMPEESSVVSNMLADCAADIYDVLVTQGSGSLADYKRLTRYLHEDPFPGQLLASWRDNPSQWQPKLFDGPDQEIPIHITYGALEDDGGEEELF